MNELWITTYISQLLRSVDSRHDRSSHKLPPPYEAAFKSLVKSQTRFLVPPAPPPLSDQFCKKSEKNGFIANENFWSPPLLPPPIGSILQKIGKIRMDLEWLKRREIEKKNCPLMTPRPPPNKKFQKFFGCFLESSETRKNSTFFFIFSSKIIKKMINFLKKIKKS